MSFATPTDLALRLGVTFTVQETLQAQAFLDDATAYLQAELGQLITAGRPPTRPAPTATRSAFLSSRSLR